MPWQAPTARDTKDDPASVRPGYCSSELPFWWPLTAPEADALRAVEAAKSGDARALASLAILASGDRRTAAQYSAMHQRIDKFVGEVRPAVEGAKDDWHRGYELHRAMHRVFFKSKGNGLDRYELSQSRFTRIFETSRYNCISSAMLFGVLARNFSLPVRGVSVPTHAFTQLDLPDGKVLEIETTSNTGFDHIHDERFYREQAAEWSSSRGLAPVTFEQYQKRQLLEPYQLMALGMLNQAGLEQGDVQARLAEAAAFADPRNVEAERMRLQLYVNEADTLQKRGAARTTVKMFDCLKPVMQEAATLWPKDPQVMRAAAWAAWYYADALAVVGRGDDAAAIVRAGIGTVDTSWEDGAGLRENYLGILMDQMLIRMDRKEFEPAVQVFEGQVEACRGSDVCRQNLEIVFLNWSAQQQNAGNWHGSREALRGCVSQLPGSKACDDALKDLESRHRF